MTMPMSEHARNDDDNGNFFSVSGTVHLADSTSMACANTRAGVPCRVKGGRSTTHAESAHA